MNQSLNLVDQNQSLDLVSGSESLTGFGQWTRVTRMEVPLDSPVTTLRHSIEQAQSSSGGTKVHLNFRS